MPLIGGRFGPKAPHPAAIMTALPLILLFLEVYNNDFQSVRGTKLMSKRLTPYNFYDKHASIMDHIVCYYLAQLAVKLYYFQQVA